MLRATFLVGLLAAGVTSPFAPGLPYEAGHRGVDFAAFPGQVISAPISGTISYVGVINAVGTITISHGARRVSLQPVLALVVIGQAVTKGEVIGRVSVAKYHCSNCLHIGVRENGKYINPTFLSRASLLPIGRSSWIDGS